MHHTESTAEEIIRIFRKHGHIHYGEGCTQLSHSVQAGLLARDDGLDEELILAAFLHDIGHLTPLEYHQDKLQTMGDFGIEAHDRWGEQYLRSKGFAERIVVAVAHHVAAKRYLCAVERDYFAQLSPASVATLGYQGGPMSKAEISAFEAQPFFRESLLIRRLDERAKAQDFAVMGEHLDYFHTIIDHFMNP